MSPRHTDNNTMCGKDRGLAITCMASLLLFLGGGVLAMTLFFEKANFAIALLFSIALLLGFAQAASSRMIAAWCALINLLLWSFIDIRIGAGTALFVAIVHLAFAWRRTRAGSRLLATDARA